MLWICFVPNCYNTLFTMYTKFSKLNKAEINNSSFPMVPGSCFPSLVLCSNLETSTLAPTVRPPLATKHSIERQSCAAHVAHFERIHPGICVRVALAICFPREVDCHPESLPIGWDLHLRADVLGDKVASQVGKTTLAPARHPVGCPAAADTSATDAVGVQHVGEGLGGVALDVASQASAASETYCHCQGAGNAKEQYQLEIHPQTSNLKPGGDS